MIILRRREVMLLGLATVLGRGFSTNASAEADNHEGAADDKGAGGGTDGGRDSAGEASSEASSDETAEYGIDYEGKSAGLSSLDLSTTESFATGSLPSGYVSTNGGSYGTALGTYSYTVGSPSDAVSSATTDLNSFVAAIEALLQYGVEALANSFFVCVSGSVVNSAGVGGSLTNAAGASVGVCVAANGNVYQTSAMGLGKAMDIQVGVTSAGWVNSYLTGGSVSAVSPQIGRAHV